MRIGVIEEVDEQVTVTAMRPDNRPHVQSIFPQGPPAPSAPVDVPGSASKSREPTHALFSTSAPVSGSADSGSAGETAVSASRYHATR